MAFKEMWSRLQKNEQDHIEKNVLIPFSNTFSEYLSIDVLRSFNEININTQNRVESLTCFY